MSVRLLINSVVRHSVCIVTVIKVVMLPLADQNDITYSVQQALILSILEASLAIILACIPTLRPLFKNSMATKAVQQSRYMSRAYSTVPFTSQTTNGFTELQDLSAPSEPLPIRQEKMHHSTIEATGRSSEDDRITKDMEMGGIIVKREFTATYVLDYSNSESR